MPIKYNQFFCALNFIRGLPVNFEKTFSFKTCPWRTAITPDLGLKLFFTVQASPVTNIFLSLVDRRLLSTTINPFLSLSRLLSESHVSILAPEESKFKSLSNFSPLFRTKWVSVIETTSPKYSLIPKSDEIFFRFFFVFSFKFFSFKIFFPKIVISKLFSYLLNKLKANS